MEPLKLNVTVEIGLKQATIDALALILNPLRGYSCETGADPIPVAPEPEKPQTEPVKEKAAAKPAPTPAPAKDDDDDLPPADAPDPVKTTHVPTEADMRKTIREARQSGVTAVQVQEYIRNTFGVATSAECPAERRQELIEGINQLKKQVA